MVLSVMPKTAEVGRVEVAKATSEGFDGMSAKRTVVKRAAEKIGPNSPCPCGSGKKYKKCCGLKD